MHHVRNRADLRPATDTLSAHGQTLPSCPITARHSQRKPKQAAHPLIHAHALTTRRWPYTPKNGSVLHQHKDCSLLFLFFPLPGVHQRRPVWVRLSVFKGYFERLSSAVGVSIWKYLRLLKIQNYNYTNEGTRGGEDISGTEMSMWIISLHAQWNICCNYKSNFKNKHCSAAS